MNSFLGRGILVMITLLSGFALCAETPVYADHLFAEGSFPASILEYQRWSFHDAMDARDSLYAAKQIARAYALAGLYEPALDFLDSSNALQKQPLFRQAMKCQILLRSDQPMLARLLAQDSDQTELIMLKGIAELYLDDGQAALDSFKRLDDASELIRIAREADRQNRRSPLLAGTLALIPGAGYAYAGSWQTGLSSLLLHALLFASAWELRQNDLPVTSGIMALIGTGFYAGNIYGSVTSAARYNRERRKSFLDNELRPYLRLP